MISTVHQLYFLPWLGYFSKIYYSDIFVVFDNADFRKRHFYDRVKIINTNGKPNYISLPTGQNFKKPCNEVFIKDVDGQERKKIIRTIQESYAKAKYYDKEWDALKTIISDAMYSTDLLVKINYKLVVDIYKYLGLGDIKTVFTSELDLNYQNATDMLIQICKKLEIDTLLLGDGKSTEIHDIDKIQNQNISIYIQKYKSLHPIYLQSRRKRAGFVSSLSVIDSILNVGKENTKDFIIGNQYKPIIYNNNLKV